ncbi:hypothetical protein F3Y22_tig00012840pilonHSYRG00081 [Hibiscus syriacus]|uniref:Uncharacterized protein n=1 Tax=Hibiscus syriacus TaxID=106335 RepID=A0A6A3C207_HIBSY|nr:hypothetical protein F3Y22_tig00012840pilonHSYRG00081 [Hibiscus syriacus]
MGGDRMKIFNGGYDQLSSNVCYFGARVPPHRGISITDMGEDPRTVTLDVVNYWVLVNNFLVGYISKHVAKQFGNFIGNFISTPSKETWSFESQWLREDNLEGNQIPTARKETIGQNQGDIGFAGQTRAWVEKTFTPMMGISIKNAEADVVMVSVEEADSLHMQDNVKRQRE